MARFPKPCANCKTLFKGDRDYCDPCHATREEKRRANQPPRKEDSAIRRKKAFLYGGDYPKRAKHIRATATVCHLCKQPFQPTDVIHADHLYPEMGSQSPLAPAHKRCNESRGNKPLT